MKVNINIIILYTLLLTIGATVRVQAQQEPQYTQYMYNTMSINPGYTGSAGTLEAILMHRSQWVGVDGAPQTQSFNIHTPIADEKMGLGLTAANDNLGPSNQVSLEGNFSYTIMTGYNTKIAFGVKAGARMLNIDWSKGRFYDANDVLLNTNVDNKILPSIGAGAYFYSDKWYVGLSVPSFIKGDYYNDVRESVITEKLQYYLIGGYVFNINDDLLIKPTVLARAMSGEPITVDVSANFLIQNTVTLGLSYRWDDSVSGLAGFQISNSFFVGYSYDYTVTDFNKYNDGSHEIIIRYQLPQKSTRIKSPRFF